MGITWREDLSIGHLAIDQQHKELLERFDSLLTACKSGEGKKELAKLIGFLDQYVIHHFSEEEKLQRLTGFPGREQHKVQHVGFIEKVSRLKTDIASEGEVQLEHILTTNNMLLDWLVNHISTSDKALGAFINKGKES